VSSPYRERVLDHYQHPRHQGRLEPPGQAAEVDNAVCGDVVRMEVRLDAEGRVAQAAFEGQGCVLSLAAASMLAEYVHGRPQAELQALSEQDVLDLMGIELGPVRAKCAVLPLMALKEALGT
jgi:nitrogen fixation NifU-like protein